ncbi:hypothetical protein C8R48DRAFT_772450 [Suillus tomentosus]|nr:hypothetical protein C8R48DRAFT_772450 [Suillus tomentosus]
MVRSQAKGKGRAPNFEPNDAPHPTTSQDLSNTNPNLDDMDADLDDMYADNLPDKGVPPATFIGGHNPPYDPTYDDFDPALEERDTRNWDDGAEELEMEHGSPRTKKLVSMSSSSANTTSTSARTFASSPSMVSQDSQTSLRPGWKKAVHKRSLSGCVQLGMSDVLEQVSSLTDNMSYIYSAKESASKYKIAKVNVLHHERDIQFQQEQGVIERSEAASVHQWSQEAKALKLRLLEAQAKVQSEKAVALHLEIELITLKEGSLSKET